MKFYFFKIFNIIIPILAIKNTNIPNKGESIAILSPPAKIAGDMSPAASIASKAPISPNIWPKNPHTNTNKLIELTKVTVLSRVVGFKNALINSAIIIINRIRVVYINRGPPSFNLAKNGFPIKGKILCSANNIIWFFKIYMSNLIV